MQFPAHCKLSGRKLCVKTLLVMRLTIAIVLAACLQNVSAGVSAQAKISLSEKNASLQDVFREIRKQTGMSFFFNDQLLKDAKPVTISVQGASLEDVLDLCFSEEPLSYVIQGNGVVLKVKAPVASISDDGDQTEDIKGKILNEKGEPEPGVSVSVKGTNTGVFTNEKGEFEIKGVPSSSVLEISHIGYEKTEVKVKGRSSFVLQLKRFVAALSDVDVEFSNGYQQIPKERATGSFDFIDNKLFDREVSTDVLSRLDGIANGVYFDKRQGNTTTPATIRGYSTLTSSTQPLIIVDNFEYNGDLEAINPNDVLNITVLKDAAAASIWGARAGNGVIVITTKNGQFKHPVKIEVNSNLTVAQKPYLFDNQSWMSSNDFINVEESLFNQGFYNANLSNTTSFPPISPVVSLLDSAQKGLVSQSYASNLINSYRKLDVRNDLLKYFYRDAVNQQYSVNMSGGGDKSTYYLSAGYDKDLSTQVGGQYDRITVRSANTFVPINNLELTGEIVYSETNSKSDNTLGQITTGGAYANIYPYAQLADDNGNPLSIVHDYSTSFVQQAQKNGFLNLQFYPLQELRNGWNTNDIKEFDTRIKAGIKYTFIPGLSADVKYQYERGESNDNALQMQQSFAARNLIDEYATVSGNVFKSYNIPLGDILNTSSNIIASQSGRSQLSFNHGWKKNIVSAIAGGEIDDVVNNGSSNAIYGYNPNVGTTQPVNFISEFKLYPAGQGTIPDGIQLSGTTNRFVSMYSNASYSYDNRYTFTVSGRKDASNLFGVNTNNKWKPLWSGGFKWDISNEKFYFSHFLPRLDFRLTYGYSGNVSNGTLAIPTISYSTRGAYETNAIYANTGGAPNPNLKWEDVGMLNVAVDFSTLKEYVIGSVEFFHKNSENLIAPVPLDPTTGLGPLANEYINSANVKGNGVDLALNIKFINYRDFKWTGTVNLNYYRDKVVKYLGLLTNPIASQYVGEPLSPSPQVGRLLEPVYAYRWGRLDSAGNPQGYLQGKLSENYVGIMDDSVSRLVYKGSALPLYYGSFMNTFNWKHLSLSANISFRFAYYFKKATINYSALYNNYQMNSDFDRRWQKPGDENRTTVPSMDYPANANRDAFYANAEPNFLRGDNIRLQDIRVSYSLDVQKYKIGFSSFQIYSYISDNGLLWRLNKAHLDPDYPSGIPPSKSIAFGVKATF